MSDERDSPQDNSQSSIMAQPIQNNNFFQPIIYDHMLGGSVTDFTVLSPTLPRNYLIRHPNMAWWSRVEQNEVNPQVGERFLVRRDVTTYEGRPLILEYITTKVAENNIYGGWTRHSIAYYENEGAPYPFHYDRFEQHRNNDYNNRDMAIPSSNMLFCYRP
jgi:hypothetical protein